MSVYEVSVLLSKSRAKASFYWEDLLMISSPLDMQIDS